MFSQGFQAAIEICVSSQNSAGGICNPLQVHSADPKQGRLFQQPDILQPLDLPLPYATRQLMCMR